MIVGLLEPRVVPGRSAAFWKELDSGNAPKKTGPFLVSGTDHFDVDVSVSSPGKKPGFFREKCVCDFLLRFPA